MGNGGFQKVMDDPRHEDLTSANRVDTVILCTGKIYYDIVEQLDESKADNLAFVRLEQIHPLPKAELDQVIQKYGRDANYIWVQEEPRNMGAWSFMLQHFTSVPLSVISRPSSASPASGSSEVHKSRQQEIIDEIFTYALRQ
jgi:2-oxoglutarate dehydrogenase E1 component